MDEHVCVKCGLIFETQTRMRSHKRKLHRKTFDSLKRDGTRKTWLIREFGRRCQICKLDEWQGQPIPIELDHIDGHPDHNEHANLRLLCPNCHAQTPTYCGRNVGHHSDTARQQKMAKYPSYRNFHRPQVLR